MADPKFQKTAINDSRFNLQKRDPRDPKAKPDTLSPGIFNNKPQFSAFTSQGNLFLNLDIATMYEFLVSVEMIAKKAEQQQMRWNISGYDKETRKRKLLGTLMAGKAEDGTVYVAVQGDGWQRPVRFDFTPYFNFARVDRDGNSIPAGEASATVAVGWSRALANTISVVHAMNYKHPEPFNRNGGGNRGGYNNGGGNRGGYNNNNQGGQSSGGFDNNLDNFNDFI